MKKLLNRWNIFLWIALFAGVTLRVLYVNDMEYKEDEEYNFTQTQLIGVSKPWPWYGIPSGVFLVNPGMSIWVFTVLAKLFGIHEPTSLAHAVQLFAILGMSLVVPFALKWVPKEDQKHWLWAFGLAMVNPFLVVYHRKLWPEGFLPFFTMLTLVGWWTRDRKLGASTWGMIGAWLGQIHMSGFFFSAALFLWTLAFDPLRRKGSQAIKKIGRSTRWDFWFFGSIAGALPLVPWLIYIIQHPVKETMSAGWNEMIQLKYWAFWLTDPTGLHLGNPLGLLRGNSNWAQISDFVRYPLIEGRATYVVGLAHLIAVLAVAWIFFRGIRALGIAIFHKKNRLQNCESLVVGRSSNTAFVQNSALWGCGLLLTATGVIIRRYYMTVTFPLEFIFLIRMADPYSRLGRNLLIALWFAELVISAGFVHYIHVNEGSGYGDYGRAYHLIIKQP